MHAWRFHASNLERPKRRGPGERARAVLSLPGERMPDLRYLDQTPASDPLDALAFASDGDDSCVVAVTHDGLVVGTYASRGARGWDARGVHYTRQHRIRAIAPLCPASVSSASSSSSIVPFLALVERKAEPRDGVLRLHAGAVGGGVDVCAPMPLERVLALAASPCAGRSGRPGRPGAFAAVGTGDGDVLAFDVVTGGVIARPGDLRGEDGGVVGLATAPWDAASSAAAGGVGDDEEKRSTPGALLVAATATRVVAYRVQLPP